MVALMRRLSVLAAAGIVVVGAACSVTSTANNGGNDGGAEGAVGEGGSSSSSSSSSGGGDSGSCKMVATTGDQACDTCLQGNCCDDVNACFNQADCRDLDKCIGTCFEADAADAATDVACANDCFKAHPTTTDAWKAQFTCGENQCKAQCS